MVETWPTTIPYLSTDTALQSLAHVEHPEILQQQVSKTLCIIYVYVGPSDDTLKLEGRLLQLLFALLKIVEHNIYCVNVVKVHESVAFTYSIWFFNH